ncbi:uncharacterized protein LOC126671230 [Mercurialis annua]|uniref:uncharacterized protein LOC126671230 n=1 Tax=Mercurialis annua TaxID=3986 RepID=UPI00215FE13D|nr:uncharacterized protein LOC126671230 [Mercurialis annua]
MVKPGKSKDTRRSQHLLISFGLLEFPYFNFYNDRALHEVPASIFDLINHVTCNWNEVLIRYLFIPAHATAILSLPIPYCAQPDRLIWKHQKSGNYTSKSGYFQASLIRHPAISPVTMHFSKTDWQNIWLLKIYPRIKVFIWRALHEALPTGEALFIRFNIDVKCVHCGSAESLSHMLFLCPFAQKIWFASPLGLLPQHFPILSFHLLWQYLSNALLTQDPSKESLQLACFVCWYIWKCRNKLLFENEIQSEEQVVRDAVAAYQEYAGINQTFSSSYSDQHVLSPQSSWLPPPRGFIKLNYDASTARLHQCGFIATVARDSDGIVIGRFHAYFRHIWDPGILELLALRESLNWAVLCSWSHVIMEGDALQVSQAINSHRILDYHTWGICQDIWRLQNRFRVCIVQYVNRKFNVLAHELASLVKNSYILGL